jgi:hypothetical protein
MALHTETEIFRTAYDLLQLVVAAVRNMPRDVKLIVGGKIRDELLEVIDLIYRANAARDAQKVPYLDELRQRVQRIEVLARTSRDMRFIDTTAYSRVVEHTQSIGRQATAWRKFSAAQAPAT